eukprot:Partr_v1_DN25760_c0_g1_i2_m74909 putative Death associated protein 3
MNRLLLALPSASTRYLQLGTRGFAAAAASSKSSSSGKKSSSKSTAADGEAPQEEIRVIIPSMARADIYLQPSVFQTDPLSKEHLNAEAHPNSFFQLNEKFLKNLSDSYGFPVTLQREFSFFRKPNFLLRRQTADIINSLLSSSGDAKRIQLSGKQGCGKTVQMLQISSFLSSENWIVLHMPTLLWLLIGSSPFSLNSATKLYDQPEAALKFIKYFSSQNKHLLADIAVSKPYEFAGVSTGDSLQKLANAATSADHAEQTMSLFSAIVDEVINQDRFKVLVAADMVNAYYVNTLYRDTNSKLLMPSDFTISRKFMDLIEGKVAVKNGSVLTSTSGYVLGAHQNETSLALAKEKAEEFQTTEITVDNFGQDETEAVLEYHMRTGFVPRDIMCRQYVKKAYLMTGGNGSQLFEMAINRPLM